MSATPPPCHCLTDSTGRATLAPVHHRAGCQRETAMGAPDLLRLPDGLLAPGADCAASHLPGRAKPALSLAATDGRQVALDGLGGGRTVSYVYPMTGRPGVDLPPGWDGIPGARG